MIVFYIITTFILISLIHGINGCEEREKMYFCGEVEKKKKMIPLGVSRVSPLKKIFEIVLYGIFRVRSRVESWVGLQTGLLYILL